MTDLPDSNAGDPLAYEEEWEHRIPDDEEENDDEDD